MPSAAFKQSLAARKLLQDTLIVLTSDHGESLGEHGEQTHGYFIYESTLRVPLILHWPHAGAAQYPARVDEPASLLDVAPTVLDFLGIPAPPQFQGHSLLRLLRPHPPESEPVYAESMYARDHLACSSLRSIRLGRYKYIEAPKPELYDLATDPGETQNRYESDRPVALDLKARLLSLYKGERRTAPKPVDPGGDFAPPLSRVFGRRSLEKRLPAPIPKIGWGNTNATVVPSSLPTPGIYPRRYANSRGCWKQDGQNVQAHFYFAVSYYRSGRLDDAVKALDATLTTCLRLCAGGRITRNHLASEERLRPRTTAVRASRCSRS